MGILFACYILGNSGDRYVADKLEPLEDSPIDPERVRLGAAQGVPSGVGLLTCLNMGGWVHCMLVLVCPDPDCPACEDATRWPSAARSRRS